MAKAIHLWKQKKGSSIHQGIGGGGGGVLWLEAVMEVGELAADAACSLCKVSITASGGAHAEPW